MDAISFKKEQDELKIIQANVTKKIEALAVTSDSDVKSIYNDMYSMHDRVCAMVSRAYDYMDAMNRQTYKTMQDHCEGHLPAIKGAGKMQKALAALGMEEDYAVVKPAIYCASTKRGPNFEVNFAKKA